MSENQDYYKVHTYGDRLRPGDKLTIEHSVSVRHDGTRLSQWTGKSPAALQSHREGSVRKEQAIYDKLRCAVKEWEEQAVHTMLLDQAIEYAKTPPVKHTANEWAVTDYGFECSNMVYRMSYQIREDTPYRSKTPTTWEVSWSLQYNFPEHSRGGGHIAGQERKKFTSKEKMDNYLVGRIAAFSDYFTELSPLVPKNLAWKFSRNGQLLPGYTVEGQKPASPQKAEPAKEQATIGTGYSKFTHKKKPKDTTRKKTAPAR